MLKRPTVLLSLAAVGLFACIPGVPAAAPPLPADQFGDVAPTPEGLASALASTSPGPSDAPTPVPADLQFGSDDRFVDVKTKTKFIPDFKFSFDALRVGFLPTVTLDTYQTSKELEIKDIRVLVEHVRVPYDTLTVGQTVGEGTMYAGTPPKASLAVRATVTETDRATYALVAVKAESPLAKIYLSDIRFTQAGDTLSIVSISNFARGNDVDYVHTTSVSARVVQSFYPGFFLMPAEPGAARLRILIYSEKDPVGGGQALKVLRQTVAIAPAQ